MLIHTGFLPDLILNLRFPEAPEFVPMALFTAAPQCRPQLPPDPQGPMVQLARQMLDIQQSRRPRKTIWLRSLLLQCMLVLYEHWDPPAASRLGPGQASPDTGDPLTNPLHPAIKLVLSSRRFVSITEAARTCHMSAKTFTKAFAQSMGASFSRFALRYRFQGAARQLLNSDDPVKTVAADWGFTDASHLHHCFLVHFGCTPSDYRRRSGFVLPQEAPDSPGRKRRRS